MSDICIPLPELIGGQKAEIKVKLYSENMQTEYRVEVFTADRSEKNQDLTNDVVFKSLKEYIDNYDKSWELIQVFAPQGEKNEIKVLYRKR